jgi:glycosyltransferase involved in cell wall biosynthesis
VRCPGNLGLLGALLAPLFSERIVAKYAGQWHAGSCISSTYRLQRWVLSSRWWRRGVVTVYGQWPDQPAQIVPFFTSMMTGEQVARSRRAAAAKVLEQPARVLYSGRLVPRKGLAVLLEAVRLAGQMGTALELAIVGDGPERSRLERLAQELGIGQRVQFHGAVPFGEMMRWYEKAHILVLASQSEGWPKAITEAMCHGVVCIGSDEGLLPWMLADRGLTVPPEDAGQLARALSELAADPGLYTTLSRNAAQWAQGYSLEGLREALRVLLAERWNVPLSDFSPPAPPVAIEVRSLMRGLP